MFIPHCGNLLLILNTESYIYNYASRPVDEYNVRAYERGGVPNERGAPASLRRVL